MWRDHALALLVVLVDFLVSLDIVHDSRERITVYNVATGVDIGSRRCGTTGVSVKGDEEGEERLCG